MSAGRSLARLAARSGLPAVARRLRRQPRGLVLMYHRVDAAPDYLGLSVPPALFEAQLARLRARARIVPLRELVARLADPRGIDTDLAAVTFDDGYQDNLDQALPILARQGVPATLFLTSGFADGSARPAGARLLDAFTALWA
ncbi:MAG: polysaccharide deacetylase family protein, partial [Deltaproteobacteria bacterium]|nr:polysaccharide deacetylase family protein [Deltaproteobacteria bacterium]